MGWTRQSSRWQTEDLRAAVRKASALENHLRDGLLRRVRDRQSHVFRSQPRRELGGLAVEGNRRPPSRHANDLAIAPAYAMIPAGAQRLHRGFLAAKRAA